MTFTAFKVGGFIVWITEKQESQANCDIFEKVIKEVSSTMTTTDWTDSYILNIYSSAANFK